MINLIELHDFITDLALMETTPNVYNQYSYNNLENSIRRKNLKLYLEEMYRRRPELLLVAEAPGYRGCRLTGVPFASEQILMGNTRGVKLFGKEAGYALAAEGSELLKEATATIVREVLIDNQLEALAWNAFPLHPHKAGNEKSNRTPTKYELILGQRPLLRLRDIFDIKEIVAVGNKAYESLNALGIKATKVRHPAQGGKRDFIEGILKIKESISR